MLYLVSSSATVLLYNQVVDGLCLHCTGRKELFWHRSLYEHKASRLFANFYSLCSNLLLTFYFYLHSNLSLHFENVAALVLVDPSATEKAQRKNLTWKNKILVFLENRVSRVNYRKRVTINKAVSITHNLKCQVKGRLKNKYLNQWLYLSEHDKPKKTSLFQKFHLRKQTGKTHKSW